jgi:hypothetical protein
MSADAERDTTQMYTGSCLCGAIKLVVVGEPAMVSHCHCTMCRKAHGAAFATYLSIERSKVRFLAGEDHLTTYNSSSTIERKFCRTCGSNIEWSGHPKFPDWTAIPLGLLDTPMDPPSIKEAFAESRVPWCEVSARAR